jgi:sulfite exporter TauE/SafE
LDQNTALALLELGLAHCADAFRQDGGLMATLFMAGLVGGTTHCAGMCGPFVLAQVAARLERVPAARMGEMTRLAGAAVLPYHAGRATTYAILGAAGATVAGMLSTLPALRWLSALLLALAALAFLGGALGRLAAWLPVAAADPGQASRAGSRRLGAGALARWSRWVSTVARPFFGSPVGWRGYALGLLLGFIPCGLLYGAVAVAAASGDPLSGGLGMLAFSAGTIPSLVGVGVAGHVAGRTLGSVVARAAPAVMALNAAVLGWMAWTLVAAT